MMEGDGSNFSAKDELELGVSFLLKNRRTDGLWCDFLTLAGESDEWVSAYIAGVLGEIPVKEAQTAAIETWKKLERRWHWTGGWGYNSTVPQDADSTAWSLRLKKRLDINNSLHAFLARRFLEGHQHKDGGISTYSEPVPIRKFTRLSTNERFAGWCSPHCCVTAAAVEALGKTARKRSVEYLRINQQPDGYWNGYWWPDHEYTTFLAVESLYKFGNTEDMIRIKTAADWIRKRFKNNNVIFSFTLQQSSPFATACGAKILALQNKNYLNSDILSPVVHWLISNQKEDGSWLPSACLRIPPPHIKDPDQHHNLSTLEDGYVHLDKFSTYTTATVISFLSLWNQNCQQ